MLMQVDLDGQVGTEVREQRLAEETQWWERGVAVVVRVER